jgi:phosphomannomutase/phosphoglucomutase
MPTVNPAIFRAYDIRGTADPSAEKPLPDLTEETARLIGRGTATYLARQYQTKNMIVGRDNRLHSKKLQKAFMAGVTATGLDVLDAGLTTSPMIYFASCFYGSDSAVNITASHNPKNENGIKIVQKYAHSIADQELQEIRQIVETEDFIHPAQPGRISPLTTVAEDYLNKITAVTKPALTRDRLLKVVIDAGNGVAGAFAPDIFRALRTADGQPACEIIELFCELDGNFPNHEANPEHAKNMVDLGRKVLETGADLGIGFDGDGDRIGVVDEKGKHYSAEYPIMLIARELLQNSPGEKVIHDVKINQALIDDLIAHGGQPVMSRVGHSYIERRLASENATFGGEKSGHLFFGERYFNYYGFDDAIFAAAKVIEALSKTTQSFSEIFANLPQRPGIPELKIPCPDQLKASIIETIARHFLEQLARAPQEQPPFSCITLDGIRITFPDGAWILIRYSNTSPSLTLHAEAPTENRLNEIKELAFGQLRQFPELKLS